MEPTDSGSDEQAEAKLIDCRLIDQVDDLMFVLHRQAVRMHNISLNSPDPLYQARCAELITSLVDDYITLLRT